MADKTSYVTISPLELFPRHEETHLETLKFRNEFTLSITPALAECFNIQSEHTREKHIWNSSMKIKQGKQNGVGGGWEGTWCD